MIRRQKIILLTILAAIGMPSCGGDASDTSAADSSLEEPAGLSGDDIDGEDYTPYLPDGKDDRYGNLGGRIEFSSACDDGDEVVIAAVGDLLLHSPLQKQAFAKSNGFRSLWIGIEDLLRAADVTYANLEGPTATGVNRRGRAVKDPGRVFDNVVYSSYPMFNYHAGLIDDLQTSGVDVVSTSNNHSLDRWALGADRTVDALRKAGMPFTGTRHRDDKVKPWETSTFTESKGYRLAWVACTYGTNGIPDREDQVAHCFEHRDQLVDHIEELAARDDVHSVIVTPHWGNEYHATPAGREIDLAHRFLEAGASAVIGAHPHVLQPWERYVTKNGRETFVIYSLGNFVSGQRHLPRRTTLLLYLGLKENPNGKLQPFSARYVPLHMSSSPSWTIEAIDRADRGFEASRQLVTDMFGLFNLHIPNPALEMTPECRPGYVPPHPHDGWIGGSCQDSASCGGTACDTDFPEGLCTETCEQFCPDRAGRQTTFCADFEAQGGQCVLRCDHSAECRDGYECQEMPRRNDPKTIVSVCVPLEAS